MSTPPTRACTGATATAEDDRFPSDAYSWNSVKIANTNESIQGSQRLMEKSSLMYWGSISCRNTGSATRAVVGKILFKFTLRYLGSYSDALIAFHLTRLSLALVEGSAHSDTQSWHGRNGNTNTKETCLMRLLCYPPRRTKHLPPSDRG
jgi:hypothetical protein